MNLVARPTSTNPKFDQQLKKHFPCEFPRSQMENKQKNKHFSNQLKTMRRRFTFKSENVTISS